MTHMSVCNNENFQIEIVVKCMLKNRKLFFLMEVQKNRLSLDFDNFWNFLSKKCCHQQHLVFSVPLARMQDSSSCPRSVSTCLPHSALCYRAPSRLYKWKPSETSPDTSKRWAYFLVSVSELYMIYEQQNVLKILLPNAKLKQNTNEHQNIS